MIVVFFFNHRTAYYMRISDWSSDVCSSDLLMVSDFFNDEDSGRLMMQITGDGTHPVKGKRRLKTTESGSGSRTFPVPQALLDLNLEGYLAALKADGEIALFPQLVVKSQKKNLLFPPFGEWWGGYTSEERRVGKEWV